MSNKLTTFFSNGSSEAVNNYLPTVPVGTQDERETAYKPQLVRIRSNDITTYICDSNDRNNKQGTNSGRFHCKWTIQGNVKKLKPDQYQLHLNIPTINDGNNTICFFSSVTSQVHVVQLDNKYYNQGTLGTLLTDMKTKLDAVGGLTWSLAAGGSPKERQITISTTGGNFYFTDCDFVRYGTNILNIPVMTAADITSSIVVGDANLMWTRFLTIESYQLTNTSHNNAEITNTRGLNLLDIIFLTEEQNHARSLLSGTFSKANTINIINNAVLDFDIDIKDEYGRSIDSFIITPANSSNNNNLIITFKTEI